MTGQACSCHPVPEHSDPLWFSKLVFLIEITMIKHYLNITLKREIILHWFATTIMWRILERNLISFKQVKIVIWSQLFPSEFAAEVVTHLNQQFNKKFKDFECELFVETVFYSFQRDFIVFCKAIHFKNKLVLCISWVINKSKNLSYVV